MNFFEIADYVCEKGKKGKKEKEARRARFFFGFFFGNLSISLGESVVESNCFAGKISTEYQLRWMICGNQVMNDAASMQESCSLSDEWW